MNNFIFVSGFCVALVNLALTPRVSAQNLLAVNAGFETNTAYYTPGWGYPDGAPDVLPGWIISLDPTGDGYAGASTSPPPAELEETHFGYIYSGWGSSGTLETAPGSRAPVQPGETYNLWFLARGDASWSETSATVSLVWHPNNNNHATTGDATNLDFTLPVRLSADDPMQTFYLSAIAPPGAHYASVRVTRPPYDYSPLLVDDFVIMGEPAEVSLSIKKHGQDAVITWPRSNKYRLEENPEPALPSAGWSPVNKPKKGKGAQDYVEYPATETSRFFRLQKAN
jgi:hypothetical protein